MSVEFKELINVKLIHILSRVQVISAAIAGSFTAQLPTSIDKKVVLFLFYLTKVNNFFFRNRQLSLWWKTLSSLARGVSCVCVVTATIQLATGIFKASERRERKICRAFLTIIKHRSPPPPPLPPPSASNSFEVASKCLDISKFINVICRVTGWIMAAYRLVIYKQQW